MASPLHGQPACSARQTPVCLPRDPATHDIGAVAADAHARCTQILSNLNVGVLSAGRTARDSILEQGTTMPVSHHSRP